MAFRLIYRNELDRERYDDCIRKDPFTPLFVESWFLDSTASNWAVITDSDYTTVMPVSIGRRFGIDYIYQPFFNRCTGIYGANPALLAGEAVNLLKKIRFWDFCMESHQDLAEEKLITTDKNYQSMVLDANFNDIYNHYSPKLRRSLRLADDDGVTIREADDINEFVTQFRINTGARIAAFDAAAYHTLSGLLHQCIKMTNTVFISAVFNNEVIAAAFFAVSGKRIIYIEGYSNATGRKRRGMHVLFNSVIERYAGTGFLLDFGGSSVPDIAHFFQSFGGVDKTYHHYYRNNLPYPLRWLK